MKLLVPVKRVIDPYVRVRVKSDHSGVEKANIKMAMNPFDEIAVEEAIRIKEQQADAEIILVSIGNSGCQETLRHGLALGADRAIHVETESDYSPLNIAKILKAISQQQTVDLVIMGKQAIDGDHNQTGQMLAGLLGWPQGTFISQCQFEGNNLVIIREVDAGLETLKLALPAVLTTDLRLNEPRYASLPNIMKAKSKPLATMTISELNLELQQGLCIQKVEPPAQRQAGKLVSSVAELVENLKQQQVI